MEQAKQEYGAQQVGRLHVEVFLETSVIVEPLVDHAQRDDRVDQEVIPGDLVERGKNKGNAVPDGKGGDKPGDVPEGGQEKYYAEQEQQVVVSCQHVGCA